MSGFLGTFHRHIRRTLLSVNRTDVPEDSHLSTFVKANREYWSDFLDPVETDSAGYVLVEAISDDPTALRQMCTIGNCIARVKELEPIYLVDERKETKVEICRSFYDGEFITVGNRGLPRRPLFSALDDPPMALSSVASWLTDSAAVDSVADIRDLSIGDVPVGDLVYNSAKRKTADGSFSDLDPALYRELLLCHLLYGQYRTVFENYDIEAATASHLFYLVNGLMARVGIEHGVDVHHVMAGLGLIRRYRQMDEVKIDSDRPSRALFERIWSNSRAYAIAKAEKIVAERLEIPVDLVQSGRSDGALESELSDGSAIESDEPTVLVMPHIFIEYQRFEDRLFRDYLTWLRELLEFAVTTDGVNWLVKPHPHRDFYDCKQTVTEEVNRIAGDVETVQVLPDTVPTERLVDAVDVLTTMDGTAGMEYSSLGIPTVLAGRSGYSGFGFTTEPATKQSYFQCLESVGRSGPLTETETARAKVMSYIHFCLLRADIPTMENGTGTDWQRARNYLLDSDPRETALYQNIRYCIEHDNRHVVPVSEIERVDEQSSSEQPLGSR